MANAVNPQLRLYSDTYNEKGYSNVEHLMKGMLNESTTLGPMITNLFYSNAQYGSKAFPLMFYTEGSGSRRGVEIDSVEFTSNVMGKPKKTSTIASTINSGSDKPGIGFSTFRISFVDRWFMMNQELYCSDINTVLRVVSDPQPDGDRFLYTVELVTADSLQYCPVEYLSAGTVWSGGIVKVGLWSSEGTEHRSQNPGKIKNQVSFVRDSYNLKGNIQNKIMVVEASLGSKSTKYFCEYELYQRTLQWKEKCESDLWYSKYNRDENGNINNIDRNGQAPIASAAGLLEQIPNEDSYSKMTTDKLTQIVRDALFNASDSTNRKIRVHTGTGGMQEAHEAMTKASSGFTLVDSKFVQGSAPDKLTYGAYFTKFRTVDGDEVEFVLTPLLDSGLRASASEAHPLTGLPLESYSMYFIDYSEYEGKKNIEYIHEKGRGDTNIIVAGLQLPPGYEQSKSIIRSTSKDESSIHWSKSQAIHINRPTNCFKVFCTIS